MKIMLANNKMNLECDLETLNFTNLEVDQMFLKRILRRLRCQHYFVLNRWSWIHPMCGTPYIVAEYICRRCNKVQLITLKNADAAAWADTMGTWRMEDVKRKR